MIRNKEKQEIYFNRYAENWAIVKRELHPRLVVVPDVDDVFVCPLCMNTFSLYAIEEDMLSVEHVPPKKAGGKARTLTCQTCNNKRGGSHLDSHLIRKLEIEDAFHHNSGKPVGVTAQLNGVRLRLDSYYSEERFARLEVPEKMRLENLAQVEAFTKQFSAGSGELKLTYRLFSSTKSDISIIRSAYLWAFSVFGYGFLIETQLGAIRAQITNPNEKILPTNGIIYLDFPDEFLGVNAIYAPAEARSYLIIFDLVSKFGTRQRVGVILPSPYYPGFGVYDWLLANKTTEITFQFVHYSENFDFNVYPLVSHHLWSELPNPADGNSL